MFTTTAFEAFSRCTVLAFEDKSPLLTITFDQVRPYHDESTSSRQITEVKHRRAGIVLGWGTAWELPVSHFFASNSKMQTYKVKQTCYMHVVLTVTWYGDTCLH